MQLALSLMLLCAVAQENDTVQTTKGLLTIKPLNHATFVLSWNGKTVYVDPVGGKERFAGQPAPDLILVTDIHGDHADARTLKAVAGEKTRVVMPKAVADKLAQDGFTAKNAAVLANGETAKLDDITVEAVPMYNLTADRLKFHDKGRGNGYVLELGGARVYVSGDTEDIPEMRKLAKIDVAFVCMNLPYTMTIEQAASAVLEFRPKVVYPYHYRGQDTAAFKALVEKGTKEVEVRLRDWYAR